MNTDEFNKISEFEESWSKRSYYEIAKYRTDDDLELETIVRVRGHDFGGEIQILHRRRCYAIGRVKGAMAWAGVGITKHNPTIYMILELALEVNSDSEKNTMGFRILERVEPGHYWRSTLTGLIAKIEKMALDI